MKSNIKPAVKISVRTIKKAFPFMLLFITFTGILAFSAWLMFHTLSYDPQSHQIKLAAKLWSDFGAHIPMVRSFSTGGNYIKIMQFQPPEYPLFPGEPIRYHFLFYLVSGLLERMGVRIDWAINLPSLYSFFALMSVIFLLSNAFFKSYTISLLSVIFFLFNGSMSFVDFFKKNPLHSKSWSDIINNIHFPSFAPWAPGDITAFWNLNIYTNQRHLAAAFAIVLFYILNIYYYRHLSKHAKFLLTIIWPFIIGSLPFFHQPTLLIIFIFMGFYFLFFPEVRKYTFIIGCLSLIIAMPQLILLRNTPKTFELYPGYLIHNELSPVRFLVYWWNNIGLNLLLVPLGYILAPRKVKIIYLPVFALFIIANLFKFSIEIIGNHKFFNLVIIMGNILSAYSISRIVRLINKIRFIPARFLFYPAVIVLLFFMVFSGIIDFFAVKNDPIGDLKDIYSDPAITWIYNHTPPDAVFLNSGYLFHPASMAGRSIYLGWPYFAWSMGYDEPRGDIMRQIYESQDPEIFCPLLYSENLSYITVEEVRNNPDLPDISLSYFSQNFSPSYKNNESTYYIFSRDNLCPDR